MKQAKDFKVEYDFDILPENLACNCALISDLPLSSEYRYNVLTKSFEKVDSKDIELIETYQGVIVGHDEDGELLRENEEVGQEGEEERAIDVQQEVQKTEKVLRNILFVKQRERLQELVDSEKEDRRKTLQEIREKVDRVRPGFANYSRDQKSQFNLNAKRSFRMFMDNGTDDVVAGRTPPTKKPKKPSPNKCRIPAQKLDVLKEVNSVILREKASGLRKAWERFYKKTVNIRLQEEAKEYQGNHKTTDFLEELEDLEVNWKSKDPATPETADMSDLDEASVASSFDDEENLNEVVQRVAV